MRKMRILVFSDSHGITRYMEEAIELHPEADIIAHLGDVSKDTEVIRQIAGDKRLINVCGNCDFFPDVPPNKLVTLNNVKVLFTHGHLEQVKFGYEMLKEVARNVGATVAVFGHTHCPVTEYDDGLYLLNPGAIRDGRYGVVDITPSGIICINMRI